MRCYRGKCPVTLPSVHDLNIRLQDAHPALMWYAVEVPLRMHAQQREASSRQTTYLRREDEHRLGILAGVTLMLASNADVLGVVFTPTSIENLGR
ncbi:hypothetical protein EV122DRAFT_283386 [Schizophyllum commune]